MLNPTCWDTNNLPGDCPAGGTWPGHHFQYRYYQKRHQECVKNIIASGEILTGTYCLYAFFTDICCLSFEIHCNMLSFSFFSALGMVSHIWHSCISAFLFEQNSLSLGQGSYSLSKIAYYFGSSQLMFDTLHGFFLEFFRISFFRICWFKIGLLFTYNISWQEV